MSRRLGYAWVLVGIALGLAAGVLHRATVELPPVFGIPTEETVVAVLSAAAVTAVMYGVYVVVLRIVVDRAPTKRRKHDVRNVLRFAFSFANLALVFGVVTRQWLGLLVSFGVIGFALTFALQQPLFSLIGWLYIMVKRPYGVGDRVAIEDSKGDVVEVDFLVTTLWEIGGEMVSSNQPSGRIITLPNSVVLSSHVYNYSWEAFPYVWNELTIQVAYETDLDFAREAMVEVADDYLGDDMVARIADYRENLEETPIELEVRDRPTVNVIQQESWVELKLRYLVHPKRGQRVRNDLYEQILTRFNAEPDRVLFPVGRNR